MRAPRTSTSRRWLPSKARSVKSIYASCTDISTMQDSTFSTRARIVMLAPALAVFTAFWLLPLVALLQASAVPDAFTAYREVLTNARYLHSLFATIALSLAVTAATLMLSTVAGLFLARREMPAKRLLVA